MNEPIQEITLKELLTPRISLDRVGGHVHLFFGETPRAQLSIKLENPMAVKLPELREIFNVFPEFSGFETQ